MSYMQFGLVRVAAEAAERNVEAIFQIKSNCSLFPKQFIRDTLKDILDSTNITLQGKHSDRTDLVVIYCRCNSVVTLYFVIKMNAESTRKGKPCEISARLVNRLSLISNFFSDLNMLISITKLANISQNQKVNRMHEIHASDLLIPSLALTK